MTDLFQPITAFFGEYRWLSNFWPCDIDFEGDYYFSVEAAYVAAKTTNLKEREIIRGLPTSGAIKKYGRLILIRGDWEEVKLPTMENFLRQKFALGTELGQKLISTGNKEIIEGNTWNDTFWGVCRGVGQNNLGKLLMKIRSEISNQ